MKVKEMTAGDKIDQPLLIAAVHEGVTGNGAPYLTLNLQDASGSLDAKLWDVKPAQKEICEAGKVIRIRGDIINYKGHAQMKILTVAPYEGEVKPEDFQALTPIDTEAMKSDVEKAIESIRHPVLHDIVEYLLGKAGEKFYTHPAASKNHHEFKGGLATHETNMLKMAYVFLEQYPFLNHDLLIAGVLCHDIGKLRELSGGVVTEYTLPGKLLGHVSIGAEMVDEAARELGYEDEKEVVLLKHMVLSHHGKYEFGSPVLPMTPEAEALNFIDNIDARMEIIRKAMEQTKPNDFSLRIYALDNRTFYRTEEDNGSE